MATFTPSPGGIMVPLEANLGTTDIMADYEAGHNVARFFDWGTTNYGPNSAVMNSRANLVARSRQLDRNNALANSAKQQYVTNVIGRGMRANLQLADNTALRDEIMALWERSKDQLDAEGRLSFEGIQSIATGSMFEAGDVLVHKRKRRTTSSLTVPLQIRVMESDMLVEGRDRPTSPMEKAGVILNDEGERVGYRVYKHHPNDVFGFQNKAESVVIPAQDMIHMFRPSRPGQVRGVPHMHAAMIRLYELDKYMDAELQRKQQAAMHVGAIYNRSGNMVPSQIWPGTTGDAGEWVSQRGQYYKAMGHLSAGTWNVLAPGDEITFNEPSDVGDNHKSFIKVNLLEVAASAGISYEQLTGDMAEVNYSSARVRLIDLRRGFEMDQQHVVAFQLCQNIWEWWLDAAVMSGRLVIPDYMENRWKYMNVEWVSDPFEFVDPATEHNVMLSKVQAGFMSRKQATMAGGRDPEAVDAENVIDQDREEQLDLFYTSNMSHVMDVEEQQVANETPETPNNNTEPLQQTAGIDKRSGFK